MKKLSLIMAGAVAMLGLASCEQDKEPVYHAPTTFEMNTPALQDQYIDLEQEGTFELVAAAQPDYGYSAITQYSAICSLTPDFAESEALKATGTGTQSKMTFKNADLAVAICALKGIQTEEDFALLTPEDLVTKVYFKGVAELEGVEGSRIESTNVVSLNQVKYYFAVPTPGYLYCIGKPFGNWSEPKEANKSTLNEFRIFEADNAIGSKVYSGVFEVNAGEAEFRFYRELTGWDGGASLGLQEADNAVEVEMVDGSYAGQLVNGKGNIKITNWEGGEMTIIVNLSNDNDMTVQIIEGAAEVFTPRYVYMVGNNAGWAEPTADNADKYEAWRLVDKKESGIYTATFDFTDFTEADGTLYCRFYQELTGWGAAQWASSTGENYDIEFGDELPTAVGEGCFCGYVAGTKVTITLDTNNNTVLFEQE